MTSIRRKLIVSILSTLVLVTLLLALVTYWSVHEELDELYDKNMEQIAVVLGGAGLEEDSFSSKFASPRTALKGEEEFLIQIWRDETLGYTSHPAIDFPPQKHDGFGTIAFRGERWRFYRLHDRENAIQIAQDIHERHGVIVEIYRVLLVPIAIQLPLLAGLVWFLIGHGLRPLSRISNMIGERTASFLEPLPEGSAPVEISTLVDALNSLLNRLKSALTSQRRFTSDAAHELRTPLAAVRLQLDILKRATDAEEKEAAIGTLEKGVMRSVRLVEQLLELARQEPGNATPSFGPVALNAVISDAVEQIRPFSTAKKIELTSDLETNLVVRGHEVQLGIMIGNLVNNAVLYTPQGGHVTIRARDKTTHVEVSIADDGIGIMPHERERIFDRFYRVAGTQTIGSGLGLSIVRNIAVAHGIEIALDDGLNGKGITFRLAISKLT